MKNKKLKKGVVSVVAASMLVTSVMPFQASARELAARDLTYTVNHALGGTATVNDAETDYWGADKAIDGIVNRDAEKPEQSRWSTNQDTNQGEKVLTVDLNESKTFDSFVIEWERTNITSFKIQVSEDGSEYSTVYTKPDKEEISSLTTRIELEKPATGRFVKLVVDGYTPGDLNWQSVSLYEFEILQEKTEANLALDATATANGYESGTAFTADKANDGKGSEDDTKSRWASDVGKGQKWLQLEFDEETKIGTVVLEWERRNATDYKIQVSNDGQEWKDVKSFTAAPAEKTQTIAFDQVETAKYVRLYVNAFDSTSEGVTWDTVSVYEFEAYPDVIDIEENQSLSEIASTLEVPQVQKGQDKFVMPEVPAGVEIEFVGADYEQIIDRDLTIYQPLVDTTVEVNFRLKRGEETLETSAFQVTVPGKITENTGNEKPVVVPELAEWAGAEGNFETSDASRIVINETYKDDLSYMAQEFKKDYKDVTGKDIEIVYGAESDAKAHDFYFTLGSEDAGLKEEGYYMEVGDVLKTEAVDKQGAYWATRSILQVLSQTGNTIAKGEVRDYPKYELRGFMLDVARKPISRETLNSILKEMTWYKMNDFQVHLNDNYIFLEDYQNAGEDEMLAYSGFRLESDIKEGGNGGLNKADMTSKDLFYTKDEFRSWIQEARKKGVDIVPEFDTPAHSLALTKVRPDLKFGENGRETDHLNLYSKYDESLEFVQSIWDEYLNGENPVFDENTIVNVGTDEYDGTYAEQFRKFTDDMLKYVQDSGRTVRLWGSLSMRKGETPVRSDNVQMNIWNTGWANPIEMYNDGYDLINMVDGTLYMVPAAGYYYDYLNTQNLYNTWEPNNMGGSVVPAGSEQMLGSAYAIWNDSVDKRSNGISEADIYDRFADAAPTMASKLWGDGEDLTFQEMEAAVEEIGEAPTNNPYAVEDADSNNEYMDYSFEEGKEFKDSSENGRDLAEGKGATIENGELKLNGEESYVSTPIDKLGSGNMLSFDITLTEEAQPGQILFETDAEYDSHDIRIMEDGTLGFTRENYDYSFGYKLPVNEKVHLVIATEGTKTTLYVDGDAYSAVGSYTDAGMKKADNISISTLRLPIERIGSKENAVQAVIDNVSVAKGKYVDPTMIDSSTFTVTTDNQQPGGEITNAFDGDESTFWHSQWSPYKGLPAEIVIDMNDTISIDKFSYLPRQDGSKNGQITKYDLFVSKTGEDGDWTQIIADGTWEANANLKTVKFDPVEARFVKFIAKDGTGDKNGTHGCAAEFNLYRNEADQPEEPTEEVSTAVLEYALSLTENVSTEGVVESVVERYNAALENAKDILKRVQDGDTTVTQEMVDNAWKELISAMQYLSFKQGDKTDLAKVIALAEEMNNNIDSYLDDGKEAFVTALEAAKAVQADGDAMQEEVNTAWKELLTAMAGLQKIPDKTALEELLNKAEGLNEADYETASFAAFRTAFADAKAVYEDEQATAEEVNAAAETLEGAIAKLTPAKGTDGSTVANAGSSTTSSDDKGTSADKKDTNTANTSNAAKGTTTKSAKTGDEANAALPAAAGILAAVAAAFVWKKRR